MATPPSAPLWPRPAASGIPASLQQHASTLQGAYVNSGRLSEGLTQLGAFDGAMTGVVSRRLKITQQTNVSVARTLAHVQSDVNAELRSAHDKVSDEVKALQMRLEMELTSAEKRVSSRLAGAVEAVREALANTDSGWQDDVKDVLQTLKTCIAKVQGGIETTEEDYMASLAQLLIFNAWTTAWPESLRTVQGMQRAGQAPPPQYAPLGFDINVLRQAMQSASSDRPPTAASPTIAASTAGGSARRGGEARAAEPT
ncbi:hypothetical protein OC835_005196 [Tilletia horrida]|nr:hypothetical protein OC835_005196 [Tilletia horrida]